MFTTGLSKNTQGNLALLGRQKWASSFYLAGGTACSLYFGHRLSFDLDFFTSKEFNPKTITERLKSLGKLTVDQDTEGTFLGSLNEIKISFFIYPYPPIFKPGIFQNVAVADLRDIACMKIDAISTRGTKRDFIDLFFICKKYKLLTLFDFFGKKYKGVDYNLFHLVKSLSYFTNAEEQQMPQMIEKISWQEVKKFYIDETRTLTKKILEI
ncbi:MAG: hypothetical protein A3H50_01845 [Candidatus Levybacteria bacterium RIFCSPLOWO2_02_FULL_37_10]|nr:MAG: hypothetical protein A2860_02155 [Candidatus Levybacteria bacterium RIFCSPHIGHO2_01_FULL_37_33]OGH17198.1 MAG: hypothetical protein A3C97_00495 [Candidatus Levybacteria bacterium RIFCSPHIGHO2_02_FULL_37_11]OGH29555.1 MAG: hypothetical protein A3F30_02575 [Candidatus Levybacteria bacterium RIFCSPHIGHO2_12_FULL_37_12]OGH43148.1 MAG: hypothetical protein A3H50_01845 [Candidatus Levybacteria bacterium RIFCSPLOWO2_02_FULL_37_10]